MKVTKMTMLRWMCGLISLNRNKNTYVRESLGVKNMDRKMRDNRLMWFGCVK